MSSRVWIRHSVTDSFQPHVIACVLFRGNLRFLYMVTYIETFISPTALSPYAFNSSLCFEMKLLSCSMKLNTLDRERCVSQQFIAAKKELTNSYY